MPATELAEWALFYNENPFGEFRADLRAGIVATVIAQVNGNKGARPSDFMPFLDKQEAKGPAPSPAAREAAKVTEAFMKASSKLRHHVIRRKPKDGGNGIAR